MKKVKLTPVEYYEFTKLAKFSFITLGVVKGLVIIEANVELLKQLGY